MPPFLSKAKPPVPVGAEQVASSHYYTAFKVILKITVIALVICISFLPTVALRNRNRQDSDRHVKNLEYPVSFAISTELERQVTHVPLRYIKAGKLIVQQLRIRGSTSVDSTTIPADEQVEQSAHVADDTVGGVQHGDYTLSGSTHEAKSVKEPTQQCVLDLKTRNVEKCPKQPILPIRDDDRVIQGRCSWQERRKHGGKCHSPNWQAMPSSLIVSEDVTPVESHGNNLVNQPTTLSISTRSSLSTSKPKLQIIETCSYESAIKTGGRCPHRLVGQNPRDKPISLTVRTESRVSNTEQQSRNVDGVLEETRGIIAFYRADSCQDPWIRTSDGWCIYWWKDGDDESEETYFPQNIRPGQVSSVEFGIEGNSGVTVAYKAGSCPSTWISTTDGWCIYEWRDGDEPLEISFPKPQNHPRGENAMQKINVYPNFITPTAGTSTPPTNGACEPPWIRTMDGRCFFDPNYRRENPRDPLSRPWKPRPRRRGNIVKGKRDVAPTWKADSCEPPGIHTSDGWCIYLPKYKHGTDDTLFGALGIIARPTVTGQPNGAAQPNGAVQPSAAEQPNTAGHPTVSTQPAATEEPVATDVAHCSNDSEGHLHCVKASTKDRKISTVHHRRGFWPDDWVPEITADCDRFPINSLTYHKCLQSVGHKNTGLKLIMFVLILAGFGSLVFLIITCLNKATRPKAQSFRQANGITNGMTAHTTSMCGNYPWNNNANVKPMNGERWLRGPPAYDPMRQFPEHHSNSLGVCSRDRNCVSVSISSGSHGTENWIRKLCNRCFKSGGSSTSDPSHNLGVLGNGLLGPRIDTLKLPNANLATVRRANGLVPSEENGHVAGSASESVRGQSAESAQTVVLGNEYGHLLGENSSAGMKGSCSVVGLYRGSGSGSASDRGSGSGSGSGSGCGSGSGSGLAAVGLTQHENLDIDTRAVHEHEAAILKCGSGNGTSKSDNANLKIKKVGFEGLEGLEEVAGWRDGEEVEPLGVEKENQKERVSSIVCVSGC
ncbi:hypothetical protein EYC80_010607 [Monilinia laxa]|uniref:Uncharacterized protein n=1 Tax=Monilinia laxa TaxID=61186 RepID=A0A5N6JQW4_MONLA|nr:hypothetical protein EYC80_010607 [Monilinia laxa]